MKKSISKLMLNHETIRTLVNDELSRVVGGVADNCSDMTRLVSGCTVTPAHSNIQSPTAKKA
jgi:hypothetical protein